MIAATEALAHFDRPALVMLGRLIESAAAVTLPAGRLLYEPEVGVVMAGVLRGPLTARDGRQLTVAYLRPSAAVGLSAAAGRAHPELGWAAAQEIAARLDELVAELDRVAFAGLRARVAYHLLALTDGDARPRSTSRCWPAAVRSVREVVARVLAVLRTDGLIATGPAGISILDTAGLTRAANQRD